MTSRRAGNSGLICPVISLGFWHNFGEEKPYDDVRNLVLKAFDHGIFHFDLANNYGRPGGSAEKNLGRILREDLAGYRDELIISTKAGYRMWDGPLGEWGSRKHLMASLDQSLERMGLRYVDIFYSHRVDSNTPLEETMSALSDAVHQGKALYIGLSNYPKDALKKAIAILKSLGTPPVLYQPHFSLADREVQQQGAMDLCRDEGVGVIPFSIFNQGLLTGKYLDGVPKDSRMGNSHNPFLNTKDLTPSLQEKLTRFHQYAQSHHRSMTELALLYVLGEPSVTSALVGVSRIEQLDELLDGLGNEPLNASMRQDLENIFSNKEAL
jgi:L-glyceraldehyde 3-phosphate reductase